MEEVCPRKRDSERKALEEGRAWWLGRCGLDQFKERAQLEGR